MKEVIIVGGGIGGLCTAIRLLNEGYRVTILEKKERVGGKINLKGNDKLNFDLTASILMTPHIYKEIFSSVGRSYDNYFKMEKLDPIYRVNYYDKTYYDFYSNNEKMINVLENMQKGLSIEYFKFLSNSFEKYLVSKEEFLDKPLININEILNSKSLSYLKRINPISTTFKYVSKNISNEKLRDYIIFTSMYIGINPYKNSNLYTLIPTISHLYGISYIQGGLYSYIKALEKLIYELGGIIKINYEVDKILIKDKKIIGTKSKGEIIYSDIVVCNADFPYAIENLFEEDIKEYKYNKKNIKEKEYSCSVFMIYLALDKKYDTLKVHNIYINKEFKNGIEAPFKGEIPNNPSFYIYCPSVIDDKTNDKILMKVNIMLRVPNLYFTNISYDEDTIRQIRDIIINSVKNINGLEDIQDHIVYEDYLTPNDLKDDYNAYYGNAFGLSHKLTQSAYLRPHLKSKNIKGLYFIGSSTHPGNGVSVIIDGSKVLSNIINSDFNIYKK